MRLAESDADSFAELYRRYGSQMYRYAWSFLRTRADAEEACSEIMLALAEGAKDYVAMGSPRAWIYAVARIRIMRILKDRKRVEPVEPAKVDQMRERALAGQAGPRQYQTICDHDLKMLLKALPVHHREVVVLWYLGDLNDVEIARLVNRTPKAVSRIRERAIKIFRERLEALNRTIESFEIDHSRSCLRRAPVLRHRRFALRGPTGIAGVPRARRAWDSF